MARLILENICKSYGTVAALDNVSLEINDQEFFVLLGPTGAGKSTTLRCIAGLEKPDRGQVLIDEDRVNDWSAAQRDVALVFQQYSLYPNLTVRQNLEFPLKSKLRKTPVAEIKRRVDDAAGIVRIGHLMDRRTDRLSGGEMQRVAIGRAIVRKPRLFLMDEPLSNLDAKLRELLRSELQQLRLQLGATFIFVTHDQVEAMTMGDRLGVLSQGQLVQVGSPYDVYNHPRNTFVASFVGTPVINLFEAGINPQGLVVKPGVFEFALHPLTHAHLAKWAGSRDRIQVGVRPEHVTLVREGGISGTIFGAEDHGVETIATIRVEDYLVRAAIPSTTPVALDQKVHFEFAQESLHFFDLVTTENLVN